MFVLVVEDDPDDQALLADVFRRTGVPLHAQFVPDSAQAIHLLEACARGLADWPNLVVLDLGLGGNGDTGFSVLRWLRETHNLSNTVVIVISGSVDPEDVQAARAQGAQAYLPKMPHPAVLGHILRAPHVQRGSAGARTWAD